MSADVVLYTDEFAKQELVLRSTSHLIRMVDTPDSDIRTVANPEVVRELVSQSAGFALSMVQKLAERGVHSATYNSFLNSFGIRPQGLIPFAEVVSADVLEPALRQREGYAYSKP